MQVVTYTGKGRAVNDNGQTLAETSNAAFLSLVYSKYARSVGQYNQLQKRYVCWARGQMRYILGDAGRSLVVGQGVNPPLRVQNEAASCNPSPSTCTRVRLAGVAAKAVCLFHAVAQLWLLSRLAACPASGKACIYMDRVLLLPSPCSKVCTIQHAKCYAELCVAG